MIFKFTLPLLLAFCLSGCFEIVEEVNYKDKESGVYMLTVNCSKSKLKLKTISKLDSFLGAKIPKEAEIRESFGLAQDAIAATKGISNVNQTMDFENYIATLTFSFDNTEHLNEALNNAAQTSSKKNPLPYTNVFSFKNNVFMRHKTPDDSLNDLSKIKSSQLSLIGDATITSIYRFANEIIKTTNKKALVSKNKKAVMLKQSISDVILHPELFINTITF